MIDNERRNSNKPAFYSRSGAEHFVIGGSGAAGTAGATNNAVNAGGNSGTGGNDGEAEAKI